MVRPGVAEVRTPRKPGWYKWQCPEHREMTDAMIQPGMNDFKGLTRLVADIRDCAGGGPDPATASHDVLEVPQRGGTQ